MKNREKAADFLAKIEARGGTELAAAIKAAAKIFDREAGDIMLLTDGQVFGIDPIIESARSSGLRVHCLGIGSAGQDFFLARLARETDAVSRSVTPRERVDLTAVDLFAAIGRPLASNLEAKVVGFEDGNISPAPPKHVFAGTPLLLFGETPGRGEGGLHLQWAEHDRPKVLDLPLAIQGGGEGETLRLLQGARLITDLEGQMEAPEGPARRIERRGLKILENLSQTYGLASRAMALVAVVERKGDRPGELAVTRVVPVGMPQDVNFLAYFGGQARLLGLTGVTGGGKVLMEEEELHDLAMPPKASFQVARKMHGKQLAKQLAGPLGLSGGRPKPEVEEEESKLVALAARIESDGGMPGKTEEERALTSILAILQFLADGHSWHTGTFRKHVQRLVKFLEGGKLQNDIVREIVKRARAGNPQPGDWSKKKPEPSLWDELKTALKK